MIDGFIKGIGYAFSGFSLILQKGIRPFVVVPLLINISVFTLGIWFASSQFDLLMDKMLGWLPGWLSWLEYLLWPFFAVMIFIAVYYTFTIVANLLASPFNSLLAERVEQKLNGLPVPEFRGYKALAGTIGKTLMSEVKKMLYMLKWLPVLLIISIIPVVNLFDGLDLDQNLAGPGAVELYRFDGERLAGFVRDRGAGVHGGFSPW